MFHIFLCIVKYFIYVKKENKPPVWFLHKGQARKRYAGDHPGSPEWGSPRAPWNGPSAHTAATLATTVAAWDSVSFIEAQMETVTPSCSGLPWTCYNLRSIHSHTRLHGSHVSKASHVSCFEPSFLCFQRKKHPETGNKCDLTVLRQYFCLWNSEHKNLEAVSPANVQSVLFYVFKKNKNKKRSINVPKSLWRDTNFQPKEKTGFPGPCQWDTRTQKVTCRCQVKMKLTALEKASADHQEMCLTFSSTKPG